MEHGTVVAFVLTAPDSSSTDRRAPVASSPRAARAKRAVVAGDAALLLWPSSSIAAQMPGSADAPPPEASEPPTSPASLPSSQVTAPRPPAQFPDALRIAALEAQISELEDQKPSLVLPQMVMCGAFTLAGLSLMGALTEGIFRHPQFQPYRHQSPRCLHR